MNNHQIISYLVLRQHRLHGGVQAVERLAHVDRLDRALAVVVTRDHDLDLAVLRALIGRELGYLGMIGSRRKAAAAVAALEAEGVSRDRLAAVRCPVGLDIHAETPAEIAVSILAELVSVVRSEDPVGGPAEGRATGARP